MKQIRRPLQPRNHATNRDKGTAIIGIGTPRQWRCPAVVLARLELPIGLQGLRKEMCPAWGRSHDCNVMQL